MSDPAWNEIFTALRDRPRRQLLDDDRAADGLCVPEDVHAGERHRDPPDRAVSNHLPLLSHEGDVDWDRERDRVSRGPRFDSIRPVFSPFDDHRDVLPASWP